MIRALTTAVFLTLAMLATTPSQAAADRKADVTALMDVALSHYKAVGPEQAAKDFADKSGKFFKGDLYVVIHGLDGTMVSHPVAPALNGKNALSLRDVDGKTFVVDLCDTAKAGGGWVDYKWAHPVTKKIAKKITYAMPADDKNFLLIGYYE